MYHRNAMGFIKDDFGWNATGAKTGPDAEVVVGLHKAYSTQCYKSDAQNGVACVVAPTTIETWHAAGVNKGLLIGAAAGLVVGGGLVLLLKRRR